MNGIHCKMIDDLQEFTLQLWHMHTQNTISWKVLFRKMLKCYAIITMHFSPCHRTTVTLVHLYVHRA